MWATNIWICRTAYSWNFLFIILCNRSGKCHNLLSWTLREMNEGVKNTKVFTILSQAKAALEDTGGAQSRSRENPAIKLLLSQNSLNLLLFLMHVCVYSWLCFFALIPRLWYTALGSMWATLTFLYSDVGFVLNLWGLIALANDYLYNPVPQNLLIDFVLEKDLNLSTLSSNLT